MINQATIFLFSALFLSACLSDTEVDKFGDHTDFSHLVSIARCTGPDLNYTTEVHSTKDSYSFFKQIFLPDSMQFEAIISGDTGFALSEEGAIKDTLSPASIEMIKSHEFHKMHLMPNQFYSDIRFDKELRYQAILCEKYLAKDHMSNPVSLLLDKTENRITGIILLNPVDTTEKIEIIYRNWMDSPMGQLVKSVEIIQASRDTFLFEFEEVKINDSGFRRISL